MAEDGVRLQEELPGTSAQNQKVSSPFASTYLAAPEDEACLLWVAGTEDYQPVSWGWGLMVPQVLLTPHTGEGTNHPSQAGPPLSL